VAAALLTGTTRYRLHMVLVGMHVFYREDSEFSLAVIADNLLAVKDKILKCMDKDYKYLRTTAKLNL